MKNYFAWSLVCVPAFLPAVSTAQTVNPANQINWPLVTGSGSPTASCTATNYGQPYTDLVANKGYTCTASGWVQTGGGGTVTVTSNQGVGANGSSAIATVPEVNYATASGNTTFTCQEDHNRGDWDVRCLRSGVTWASNPSQALINTIQAAECYKFTQGGVNPVVHLPAGTYSIGGNISLPPGLDVEGAGGSQYGFLTILNTTDSTQAMFTHVNSQTFTCNSVPYTANAGMSTLGNVTLQGGGSASPNDIGILNGTSGGSAFEYLHNVAFQGFGGPGVSQVSGANGQNSRGNDIWAAADLQWYYFGGTYNTSGFTDTANHCELEIGAIDSRWNNLEVTGQLPDSGYYNRAKLWAACVDAGIVTNSFFQLAPHLLLSGIGPTEVIVTDNRFDGAWWEAIQLEQAGTVKNNSFSGYCISPTLNPTNFPSNPGGVSTDPNCSAFTIDGTSGGSFGSQVSGNFVEESGLWSNWPVYAMYFPNNVLGGVPSKVDQPPATLGTLLLGGYLGSNSAVNNPGADVGQSMYDATLQVSNNVGGTAHFNLFKHLNLNDSAATSYNNFDGLYPDAYVTIFVNANDTIQNGGAFHTCTGGNITGAGLSWWWYINGFGLYQQACAGGGGGGGGSISGLTANYIPLAGGATSLTANSPLDYGVSAAGVVTSAKPVAVNDGSGLGGQFDGTEGAAPTGVAGQDILWADSTAHGLKKNENNAGATYVVGIATAGTSGDNVALAANGRDIIDAGAPANSFTPTKTADSGAGTSPTVSLTSGANDDAGWVTVTTGTSPAASAGVVTITYGGTYTTIRKCSVQGVNAAAAALSGNAQVYISIGNSTLTNFVISVGSTPLAASTTYQWLYRCSK